MSPTDKGVQGLGRFKKKSQTTDPIASTGIARVFSSRVNGKPKAHSRLTVDLEAPSPTAYVLTQGQQGESSSIYFTAVAAMNNKSSALD